MSTEQFGNLQRVIEFIAIKSQWQYLYIRLSSITTSVEINV